MSFNNGKLFVIPTSKSSRNNVFIEIMWTVASNVDMS